MSTNLKNSIKNINKPVSTDYCFQSYFTQNNQLFQSQETYNRKLFNDNGNKSTQEMPMKNLSGLKFKIESVGVHPENDDDLHMCPARVRPSWPKKIIPWWVATSRDEKPPYSYATLIAHAILSSRDGRLTLNDIYTWITENYPAFSIGNGGWQNSIRHNLSLNKKWFCKIDRRPTQANPGKGCYWTLIAGTEQIFIDNLTQEGGHSRKHHDIGLTAELSIRQRRGACFYHNAPSTIVTPDYNQPLQQNSTFDKNTTGALSTPPPTPTKSKISIPPLYTTFKMVDMSEKSQRSEDVHDDSDNDSGVDVNIKFVDTKHFRKRRRTTTKNDSDVNKKRSVSDSTSSPPSSMQELQHVDASMVYDTPASTPISSFDLAPTPTMFEINNWVEQSLTHTHNHPQHDNQFQWPTQIENNLWCDAIVVPPPMPVPSGMNALSNINRKRSPITINLDDEEFTQKYLHFEEDEEDLNFHASIPHCNNTIPTTMPTNTYNTIAHKLYPHTDPSNFHSNITTRKVAPTTYIAPSSPNHTLLTNNQFLQQFVTMQDILYS